MKIVENILSETLKNFTIFNKNQKKIYKLENLKIFLGNCENIFCNILNFQEFWGEGRVIRNIEKNFREFKILIYEILEKNLLHFGTFFLE